MCQYDAGDWSPVVEDADLSVESRSGRSGAERMADVTADGAQVFPGAVGQHGAQGRQDLRHRSGLEQPPPQQSGGVAQRQRQLRRLAAAQRSFQSAR